MSGLREWKLRKLDLAGHWIVADLDCAYTDADCAYADADDAYADSDCAYTDSDCA